MPFNVRIKSKREKPLCGSWTYGLIFFFFFRNWKRRLSSHCLARIQVSPACGLITSFKKSLVTCFFKSNSAAFCMCIKLQCRCYSDANHIPWRVFVHSFGRKHAYEIIRLQRMHTLNNQISSKGGKWEFSRHLVVECVNNISRTNIWCLEEARCNVTHWNSVVYGLLDRRKHQCLHVFFFWGYGLCYCFCLLYGKVK